MSENQRQILDADVRDISYLDEGTGPAIVLLPEAGLDFAYFGALASILVEEDFRVVRIAARRFLVSQGLTFSGSCPSQT